MLGAVGGKRSPLKEKNQISTKTVQCSSQRQQQCSFCSFAGSDSEEDNLLPLFERIRLGQIETTTQDPISKHCLSVEAGSSDDPIVID